jgi:hypothetical protein
VDELFFDVPLKYQEPLGSSIRIFARSVRQQDFSPNNHSQVPWFVYLTGGPGFGCGLPQDTKFVPFILDKGYQVSEDQISYLHMTKC